MRAYNFLPSEFALSDIALRRLRISRLRDLNDPFELLASNMEGDKRFLSGMASWKNEINEMFGLLCFSRSWENPVLWSHYGDKHHGICLGFDIREELVEPVRYVGDRIPVIFEDDNPENGLAKSFVLDLLRTKYEHWIYEEEVRVFVTLDH